MSVFKTNKRTRLKRNAFDLSHDKKLSFKMGQLIPILHQEVVPGDTFKVNTETFLRFAPMISPIMHRIDAYVHYFFVPNRIIFDDWEKFITGDDSVSLPMLTKTEVNSNGLLDYLGIEPGTFTNGGLPMNPIPWYGYNKIWNEYYRDQDIQSEVNLNSELILNRNWEKDYFTSARPTAQDGTPVEVDIDITYKDPAETDGASGAVTVASGEMKSNGADMTVENIDTASFEIEALRVSNRLQKWLERNKRGGTRYVEHILNHFGVTSPDSRLQRPEYLGGGKTPVSISEILKTSESNAAGEEALGTMAGHGMSVGTTNKFNKYFTEHGFIWGLMSVMPRLAYTSQVEKFWLREEPTEFYFPEFANLGEQEVLNREIHADAVSGASVFGYQSRYADYKYKPSTVHGDFRDTFDFWHLHRQFTKTINLNEGFIKCDPSNRIFAVQDSNDYLWAQVFNNVTAIRPMPYHVVPNL